MLDPQQESNEHSDLDGMVLAHEQEQELIQEEDAEPSTRGEDVVPTDLLWKDVARISASYARGQPKKAPPLCRSMLVLTSTV